MLPHAPIISSQPTASQTHGTRVGVTTKKYECCEWNLQQGEPKERQMNLCEELDGRFMFTIKFSWYTNFCKWLCDWGCLVPSRSSPIQTRCVRRDGKGGRADCGGSEPALWPVEGRRAKQATTCQLCDGRISFYSKTREELGWAAAESLNGAQPPHVVFVVLVITAAVWRSVPDVWQEALRHQVVPLVEEHVWRVLLHLGSVTLLAAAVIVQIPAVVRVVCVGNVVASGQHTRVTLWRDNSPFRNKLAYCHQGPRSVFLSTPRSAPGSPRMQFHLHYIQQPVNPGWRSLWYYCLPIAI